MKRVRIHAISPAILAGCCLLGLLAAGCGNAPPETAVPVPNPASEATRAPAPASPASNHAVLVTGSGEIELELLPDQAPLTVANFKQLAGGGFYDGTTFHRVIKDLLIQGGDPNSKDPNPLNDGLGTSGSFVKFEANDEPMTAGAVAMARDPDNRDSASCQFFICLKDQPKWQGEYAIFARVRGGLEVAGKISRVSVGTGQLAEHPIFKQAIERIEFR